MEHRWVNQGDGLWKCDDCKACTLDKIKFYDPDERIEYSGTPDCEARNHAWDSSLGRRLRNLIQDHTMWSNATFGSERGPIGSLRHLAKEAVEAESGDPVEYADCLLLWLDAMRRAGFDFDTMLEVAEDKLKINKGRTWPTPIPDEAIPHVRSI